MSLFSNIANMSIAKRDRDKTYQRQIELLEKQNQYNTDMFNKTNEYNEPTNQLNRLMGAGASGGGALAMMGNQTANSIGSSTAPSVAGLNPGLANMFGDFGQKTAELANLKADTRLKNAEANRNEDTLFFDIEKTKAEVDKLAGELNLTNEQTDNLKILNKYADLKSQEEINQIIMNCKLVEQQIANAKEDEKKQIWENFYRDNFGIDPNSKIMNQIVTSSLKGDMPSVFGAFEKTANFVFDKLNKYIDNKSNKLLERIGINKPDGISLKDTFNEKTDKWIEKRRKKTYNNIKETYERFNPGKTLNFNK